jgi:hypothetical protein
MKNLDKKLPNNIEQLEKLAEETDNPQMKRAIQERLKTISNDKIVRK